MSATPSFSIPGQQQLQPSETRADRREQRADEYSAMNLPPGFRFHPTDEEIVVHYLGNKAIDPEFTAAAMGDIDLTKVEPWDLPAKVKIVGGKQQNLQMYLFNQRDRKYPTGNRTNRATDRGYWKATGKDKNIYTKVGNKKLLVGMKKTLVFYTGRAPKGVKSNWVMHEYRLEIAGGVDPERSYWALVTEGHPEKLQDEWVVCRVIHKPGDRKAPLASSSVKREEVDSVDDASCDQSADEPPPLVEPTYTDSGNGVVAKYATGGTMANSTDIKRIIAPATPQYRPSHIGNAAVPFNTYGPTTGNGTSTRPVTFANGTQINQMTPPMMIGNTTSSAQFDNRVPNPMNPPLQFDNNLLYGHNTIDNFGAFESFFNTVGALQQQAVPPMKMIPTPRTPSHQFNTDQAPVYGSSSVKIFSPDVSPGGSSVQQMTSGGGGSVYMDATLDGYQFLTGSQFMVSGASNNSWRKLR